MNTEYKPGERVIVDTGYPNALLRTGTVKWGSHSNGRDWTVAVDLDKAGELTRRIEWVRDPKRITKQA